MYESTAANNTPKNIKNLVHLAHLRLFNYFIILVRIKTF